MSVPQARFAAGMAYDSGRQKMVLFGGCTVSTGGAANCLNDTWEYDYTTKSWSQITTAHAPTARARMGMCYDTVNSRTVLFGGGAADGVGANMKNDVWFYNGTDWTQATTSGGPPSARDVYSAFAFDQSRGVAVLFGGFNGSVDLNDTWELTGTAWASISPVASPSIRHEPFMGYSGVIGYHGIALFGGLHSSTYFQDVYIYTGTTWNAVSITGIQPSIRGGGTFVFDPQMQRMWLFSGDNAFIDQSTWELQNPGSATWVEYNPTIVPTSRDHAGMALNSDKSIIMVFGGLNGTSVYGDTWFWSDSAGGFWTKDQPNQPNAVPNMLDARQVAINKIRVFFDEPMLGLTTSGNYIVSGGLSVSSVASVDNQTADLTMTTNLARNTAYTVTGGIGLTNGSGATLGAAEVAFESWGNFVTPALSPSSSHKSNTKKATTIQGDFISKRKHWRGFAGGFD